MPYELLLEHCSEQHLCAETDGEEHIYEQTGLFHVITTAPVALFSDDGTTLQMVYANDAYQKVMAELGFYSLEEINHKRRSRNGKNEIIRSLQHREAAFFALLAQKTAAKKVAAALRGLYVDEFCGIDVIPSLPVRLCGRTAAVAAGRDGYAGSQQKKPSAA